jgi:hypothetical protein
MKKPAGCYTGAEGCALDQTRFYNVFFALMESLTANTITVTSKRLLMSYMESAEENGLAERARSAIRRYMQKEIPTLEDLRRKSPEELSKIDHLVLKMEYEASRAG